jgi:hypothetical protein
MVIEALLKLLDESGEGARVGRGQFVVRAYVVPFIGLQTVCEGLNVWVHVCLPDCRYEMEVIIKLKIVHILSMRSHQIINFSSFRIMCASLFLSIFKFQNGNISEETVFFLDLSEEIF